MDIKQKVIETIEKAGKPLKGKEISELSGIEKKQVDKLIKELKVEGVIISPKNCFYDIKK